MTFTSDSWILQHKTDYFKIAVKMIDVIFIDEFYDKRKSLNEI